jgi:peptidyl-tRNA hydrolase, PTH1 family
MYFIIGLGNPGDEYDNTRHNLGFACVDELARRLDMRFEHQTKLKGGVAKKDNVVLVKPDTFMNLSGECVQKVIAFYDKTLVGQKDLRTVYVAHDDLDLRFGQTKLVYNSGPKAHNGLISVREKLGTSTFWYARLGVDGRSPDFCPEPHSYVLSKFTKEEIPTALLMIREIVDHLYALVTS